MSSMSHHPAKPTDLAPSRQKCNGRSCYPNKHVADRDKEIIAQSDQKHVAFKCKQCGMWHLKMV